MKRKLSNWLESYLEYVEETESATIFKKWVGISTISAVLRRKIWLQFGRIKIFPNLFIILVGPPGSRKTAAINFGRALLEKQTDITICPDATTKEALCKTIARSKAEFNLENKVLVHCSVTAINSELETLLGKSKDNAKMVAFLLELWDCPERFTADTKHVGKDEIYNCYFSMIAASTQQSIATCVPRSATGSGLIARLIFCYAEKKSKDVAIPKSSEKIERLKDSLIYDLSSISILHGAYEFSKEAEEYWYEIYSSLSYEIPSERICSDPNFDSWYDRKQDFVKKLSVIDAASRSNDLIIEKFNIDNALFIIREVEKDMGKALKILGRSEVISEIELVSNIIRIHKRILDNKLRYTVINDVDDKKFTNVIETLIKSGKVRRDHSKVKEEKNFSYIWMDHAE